jgi:hypothetical protein
MMHGTTFPDQRAFAQAARSLGITAVVIAWQDEYGQDPDHSAVTYRQLQRITLLAYHRGSSSILQCQLDGGSEMRRRMRTELEASGFTVAERSRNMLGMTTYPGA